jgi:nitrogen regulatory protein P-II 1
VAAVPLETYGHGVIDDAYGRLRMTKLEVDIADARVGEVVALIEQAAKTGEGHPGDGRILITNVEAALRIDTGERDEEALK